MNLAVTCPQKTNEHDCITTACTFCCQTGKCFASTVAAEQSGCQSFVQSVTCEQAGQIIESAMRAWSPVFTVFLIIGVLVVVAVPICFCIWIVRRQEEQRRQPAFGEKQPMLGGQP